MTTEPLNKIKQQLTEALDDPQKLEEFELLLSKALNTWLPAPAWLLKMSDELYALRHPLDQPK